MAKGERVRVCLDCSAPHLYHVSSSVPMSCSQVLSVLFVGPVIVDLWRAVGSPTLGDGGAGMIWLCGQGLLRVTPKKYIEMAL